jgi:hypothetical protein
MRSLRRRGKAWHSGSTRVVAAKQQRPWSLYGRQSRCLVHSIADPTRVVAAKRQRPWSLYSRQSPVPGPRTTRVVARSSNGPGPCRVDEAGASAWCTGMALSTKTPDPAPAALRQESCGAADTQSRDATNRLVWLARDHGNVPVVSYSDKCAGHAWPRLARAKRLMRWMGLWAVGFDWWRRFLSSQFSVR